MTGQMIEIFAFPLNLVLFIIWAGVVTASWHNARKSAFVRFMLSPAATLSAISLTLLASLVIGLTGFRSLVSSWAFIILVLYFQTVLAYVILRGWRRTCADGSRKIRWRFIFLHAGLLTVVASSFWAAPDNFTLRTRAMADIPVSEAYNADGRTYWLRYEVELKGFEIQYDDAGMPSDYSADVLLAGRPVTLKVNHPYRVTPAETVYLTGYDEKEGSYCILQIVHEPCRWVTLAGIVMMLAGALLLFINGPRRRKEVEP